MANNNNNNNGGALSAIDSLIDMNDVQQLMSDSGVSMENFIDLYTSAFGDTTGESFGQMKSYFNPETYVGMPEPIVSSGLDIGQGYMDELNKIISNRAANADSLNAIWGAADAPEDKGGALKSIMGWLQRLLPGGKTGSPK